MSLFCSPYVRAKSLVEINSIEKDEDELHFGTVCEMEHWSKNRVNKESTELSNSLENIFSENSLLNNLYPKKSLGNAHWVLARWLEILPIALNVKSEFVNKFNAEEANEFVESIIFKR